MPPPLGLLRSTNLDDLGTIASLSGDARPRKGKKKHATGLASPQSPEAQAKPII